MTTAQTLRDAAALLLQKADEIDGKPAPSGFDPNNKASWWPAMLKQFEDKSKPHPYVQWTTGVLPEDSGTNEKPPRSYDTHRALWEAAQRERAPDSQGRPFSIFNFLPLGPDAIHQAIVDLWNSDWGKAWRAHPLNANIAPKAEPTRF